MREDAFALELKQMMALESRLAVDMPNRNWAPVLHRTIIDSSWLEGVCVKNSLEKYVCWRGLARWAGRDEGVEWEERNESETVLVLQIQSGL